MTVRCRAVALPEAGGRPRPNTVAAGLARTGAPTIAARRLFGTVEQTACAIIEATADAPIAQRISIAKINQGFDDVKAGRGSRPMIVCGGER
jgi:hypothetical protein